jgi:hypothetical protein
MPVLYTFERNHSSTSRRSRVVLTTIAVIVATTVFLVVGACMLPHDRYLRFKSSTDSEFAKFGWVYERIHFDRRPIDVAFFGDSRTMLGVDSALVEQSFANASGQTLNVVNFSHTGVGRDLDYLTARELLQNAHARLLVIGVSKTEGGTLDPAFELLADPRDLWKATLLVDPRYATELLRLPSRQLTLLARTMAPKLLGGSGQFNPATYRGPHWDNPELEFGDHGLFRPSVYEETSSEGEVKADQQKKAKLMWAPNAHLPLAVQAKLRRLKNRASLFWLSKLLDLAKQMNVPVRFLYLPAWRDHVVPEQADFYGGYAPTWSYPSAIDRIDWWYDSTHLNRNGSIAFSDWLGRRLAEYFQEQQSASVR